MICPLRIKGIWIDMFKYISVDKHNRDMFALEQRLRKEFDDTLEERRGELLWEEDKWNKLRNTIDYRGKVIERLEKERNKLSEKISELNKNLYDEKNTADMYRGLYYSEEKRWKKKNYILASIGMTPLSSIPRCNNSWLAMHYAISFLEEMQTITENEIKYETNGIGKKSLERIKAAMKEKGLSFKAPEKKGESD